MKKENDSLLLFTELESENSDNDDDSDTEEEDFVFAAILASAAMGCTLF